MGTSDIPRIRNRFKGKSWDLWLDELDLLKPGTQRLYLEAMESFLNYLGLNPEELWEKWEEEKETEDSRDRGQTAKLVKKFMKKLEDQGYSKSKSRQVSKAVSSFFKANMAFDFKIPRLEKVYSKQRKTAKLEEVKAFIQNATSLRTQAIIATFKDSGLRSGDLCNIRLEQVKPCLDSEADWCQIQLPTEKENVWSYTMIGPESMYYLKLYLQDREQKGIESEWLFCHHLRSHKGKKMNSQGISQIFDRLQDKTGIPGLSAHSLRRFHTSQLTADGMDSNWVKLCQGKMLDPSMRPYFDPSKLPEIYQKHYHVIVVMSRVNVKTVKKLEMTIAELEARIAEMEPAFRFAQTLFAEKRDRDRLRESSKEPPIPIDLEG